MARPLSATAAPAAASAGAQQKQTAESRGLAPVSLGNQKYSNSQALLCLCLLLLTTWEGRHAAAHPLDAISAAGDSLKPEEPNKNLIFLFGINNCKEGELASIIASVISEAAQQTRSIRAREDEQKKEENKQEESMQLRVSASAGEPRITGTARTSTVYILQQESLSAFRARPLQPPLCEIDSVTLHHLNCQTISLKQCNSFIDPDILKEIAQKTDCVDVVDFDYKASPAGSWESIVSEGRRGGLSLMAKHISRDLPNDPHLLAGEQWELLEGVGVEAQKAWRSTRGGAGTVVEQPLNTVAIIDFGFNMQHEDLVESWWRNANLANPKLSEWPHNCFDGIDNDRNGYIDDCLGYSFADRSADFAAFSGEHGTAVASACCASTNNSRGVASLGWNLRPMALKIDGSYSQMAEALNYAADKMVSVVNMSFGGPPSAALRAALAVAAARDMSLIVAAGNHHVDFASVNGGKMPRKALKGFPAGYGDLFPNLVAVAAIASDGRPAKFTNFDSSENPKIHVLAPGEFILACSDIGAKDYVRVSGTSFATPIVAAVAALIRYESPELSAKDVKQVIIRSCYRSPHYMLERLAKCGGILSAAKALKNAGVLPRRN